MNTERGWHIDPQIFCFTEIEKVTEDCAADHKSL